MIYLLVPLAIIGFALFIRDRLRGNEKIYVEDLEPRDDTPAGKDPILWIYDKGNPNRKLKVSIGPPRYWAGREDRLIKFKTLNGWVKYEDLIRVDGIYGVRKSPEEMIKEAHNRWRESCSVNAEINRADQRYG